MLFETVLSIRLLPCLYFATSYIYRVIVLKIFCSFKVGKSFRVKIQNKKIYNIAIGLKQYNALFSKAVAYLVINIFV